LLVAEQMSARAESDADLPSPRQFSDEEIKGWLAEDEAGMRQFRDGK
jgi:hypothetical protein